MITQTIVFECDVFDCKNEHTRTRYIIPGTPLEEAWIPDGWQHINGSLICDKHNVELVVTPKEV